MQIFNLEDIQQALVMKDVIDAMREAVIAQARGECETPMPMHIPVPPEDAVVHIKASYRLNGPYFAMKVASSFPKNYDRGLTAGPGMMMLFSAETGMPVALYRDHGYLTDMRTAAVAAMVAREVGRTDEVVGIIGAGIQGRCQAQMLAEVIPLRQVFVYDLDAKHAADYVRKMKRVLPHVEVTVCDTPAAVARSAKLIVTVTPAREPHFKVSDVQPGTHINAVGSDSPGKQELDPDVLRAASLYLVDSIAQSERLGELQHAPDAKEKAVEIGTFCDAPVDFDRAGITVADMTGLGVEDLYIAKLMFERLGASS